MNFDDLDAEPPERASSDWTGTRATAYGRLYRHRSDRLERSGPSDPSVVIGRSGSSGYRGGRPFFGADEKMRWRAGQIEYEGPPLGGVLLGGACLLVLWKALTSAG